MTLNDCKLKRIDLKRALKFDTVVNNLLKVIVPKLLHNSFVEFKDHISSKEICEKYENVNRSIFSYRVVSNLDTRFINGITFLRNEFDIDIFIISKPKSHIYESIVRQHRIQPRYIWGDKPEHFKNCSDTLDDFIDEHNILCNNTGLLFVSRLCTPTSVVESPISYFVEIKE